MYEYLNFAANCYCVCLCAAYRSVYIVLHPYKYNCIATNWTHFMVYALVCTLCDRLQSPHVDQSTNWILWCDHNTVTPKHIWRVCVSSMFFYFIFMCTYIFIALLFCVWKFSPHRGQFQFSCSIWFHVCARVSPKIYSKFIKIVNTNKKMLIHRFVAEKQQQTKKIFNMR